MKITTCWRHWRQHSDLSPYCLCMIKKACRRHAGGLFAVMHLAIFPQPLATGQTPVEEGTADDPVEAHTEPDPHHAKTQHHAQKISGDDTPAPHTQQRYPHGEFGIARDRK